MDFEDSDEILALRAIYGDRLSFRDGCVDFGGVLIMKLPHGYPQGRVTFIRGGSKQICDLEEELGEQERLFDLITCFLEEQEKTPKEATSADVVEGEEKATQQEVASAHVHDQEGKRWVYESYRKQSREIWPGRGQHILAQFDEDSVVVYQAYKAEIAEYAVKHQTFQGCALFGTSRMTWIKTNFLWMMFRSKWASKKNQSHVLAIWLKRESFEQYLEAARTKGSVREFQGTVRLQWDPDHFPNGEKHPYRRAVQLGLKNVTSFLDGTDIIAIEDISEFVSEQRKIALDKKQRNLADLLVARERVYNPASAAARKAMQLSEAPSEVSIET